MTNRQTSPPTLADFHHDMNEHGGADYRAAGEDLVLELERRRSVRALGKPEGDRPDDSWRLLVWEAVQDDHGYLPPDGKEGNRYAWDARGSKEFEDGDDARAVFKRLTGNPEAVREFVEANPYGGPRSPHSERVDEEHVNARGDCPNCGATDQPRSGTCSECGKRVD